MTLKLGLRNIVLSVGLLACLLSSYLLFHRSHTSLPAIAHTLVEESMSGVQVQRFDKSGRLNQIIKMDSWEHLKNSHVTTMVMPSLTIYDPDGRICEISADKGEGFQSNLKSPVEKLHLIDNVTLYQLGQSPNAWWELKTNSLLYFPSSESALTDEIVTVISPSMTLQAQGMRAYLNTHRVEFINQVTSHYAKRT